ncbi:hypothetical protein F966_02015 [Acinetobacter higginsii]|uniref:Type I restriction modification DNA specificity domain-containing protein n=1 Tax=Acinetobacter higginsii TaxID=70347 RepID=N8XPH8_9GAMM|nr:restriction endonuclease subunit S [Acinetobacter higginsii]ENV09358.1 hypothetical protein F966_02015 [Acinetobacter higginsii]
MVPKGWKLIPLEHIADPTAAIRYGVVQVGEHTNGGIPIVPIKFIKSINTAKLHQSSLKIEGKYKNSRIQGGDVLISVKGTIGAVGIVPEGFSGNIAREIARIRPSNKFDSNYIAFQLQADHTQREIENLTVGTTRKEFSIHTLKKFEILVPPLSEQQKITQILLTWDQAISTTKKLLENSQQQKKALMQQLLTGKKRLLDENGRSFSEEWQSGHLVDIAKISKGKALSSKDLKSGSYPVIAGGKTSPYTHSEYTHENVITVSASGAYAGYVAFYPYKIWASDCSVVSNKIGSDINFIYQLLISMQTIIYSLQSGGAQPHIYPKDIESLKVLIPPLVEQQKIAKVFAVVDQEIDTFQKKLDCLKQEKKALMQQLLTGKKRVKVAA